MLTSASKRRIFLVEDHPVTRDGFAQLLNYQEDLEVCGQAGSIADALKQIPALLPELAIVDISLPDGEGIELIESLSVQAPGVKVLALSMHDESVYAPRALAAGAKGYVMKQTPTETVMSAIRRVLDGEIYLSPALEHLRKK